MLILSRKKAERILIGQDVYITIVNIKGDKVQVGIEAPREVDVNREEVALAKLAQETKKD
jgi:carbon storage regulator